VRDFLLNEFATVIDFYNSPKSIVKPHKWFFYCWGVTSKAFQNSFKTRSYWRMQLFLLCPRNVICL